MKPLSYFSHYNLELMQSMRVLDFIVFVQSSRCIFNLLQNGQQQIIVLRVELQLAKSIGKVLHFNKCLVNVFSNLLKRLKIVMRLFFGGPSFVRLHIHSELSWLQPATIEQKSYLLIAIINPWEEDHVDKVLKPSIQESPPPINECK